MSKSKTHSKTEDWSQNEVLFAVKNRGSNLSKLAEANGYDNRRALYVVFYRKNAPTAQKIIADFLELKPEEIWPSRYQSLTVKYTSPAVRPHVRVA
ncbi:MULTISPECIES: helix-turn-helix domain-containing protein [unclassified Neptuniibacter]|uniref:helix-turn-helix domain-containing protein n=1 Tax=unclassified Neptuniibacter TaxID=2630693 RepID=UPI000C5FFA24|nr:MULTISPECIES: helix-turn-helix domain-containing protein [unclassified Neptuniibacter]MAY42606.1 transcriptional regulator [Oceanospirillaceae bacterium]|tara:strand:- start:1190 stop:1477 length:288 start_codon:yes stop_codon:yes gene_type:complete